MDCSTVLDKGVRSASNGCHFLVQKVCVPERGDPQFPFQHNIYYPAEGSARYLMTATGPVRKRYVLRHFVLGYGNGGYVIGWYYDRIADIREDDMTMNDIIISEYDNLTNVSKAALYARKPNGGFIKGPVWLCALSSTGNAWCKQGPKDAQWDKRPVFVLHGRGWYVPSWIVPPNPLARHCRVTLRRPHELPEAGILARPARQAPDAAADVAADANNITKKRKVNE